jgi:hypothetical protein
VAGETMKEIKKIDRVCKGVYFDYENNLYFCEFCGTARFSTKAQAVGHLSQCPKKDSVNIPPPTTTTTTTSTSPPKLDLLQAKASQERLLALYEKKRLARIEERDVVLTNEVPHLRAVQQVQAVQQVGSLSVPNQFWLGLGIAGLVGYLFGQSFCRCDVGGSPQINQKPPSPKPVSNIVSSLATRLANRGSDKFLSFLLGKIRLK